MKGVNCNCFHEVIVSFQRNGNVILVNYLDEGFLVFNIEWTDINIDI